MRTASGGTIITRISTQGNMIQREFSNGVQTFGSDTGIVAREFTIDDWTGMVSIDVLGNVSATQGNSRTAVTFTPTTFGGRVGAATERTVNVTVGVPDDSTRWTNANMDVSGDVMATQPQGIFIPDVDITTVTPSQNAIVVDWTVNAMNGNISSQTVEYGTTTAYGQTVSGVDANDVTATITGLSPQQDYFIRVSATNQAGTGRDTASATTTAAALQPADIITGIFVNIDGDITVTTNNRGFVYYIGAAATGGQTFTGASNSVMANNVYPLVDRDTNRLPFIGIEVDDSSVPNDGAQLSIRTIQNVVQPPALPNVVTTGGGVNADRTSATLSGTINDGIGAAADTVVFYYVISTNSTETEATILGGTQVTASGTTGSVTADITYAASFDARFLHYIISASNTRGTSNGQVISRSVTALTIQPNTVTTRAASGVMDLSATLNGTVTMGAGNSLGETGFIWSTSEADMNTAVANTRGLWPASVQSVVRTPSDFGDYSAVATGLTQTTEYYVAAYTVNPTGHAYGAVDSFTTEASIMVPTLTRPNVTPSGFGAGRTQNFEAEVTNNGGEDPTVVGFELADDNAFTQNVITLNGALAADGTITASILNSGLANNFYWIRTFATNSAGTGFSNTQSFVVS